MEMTHGRCDALPGDMMPSRNPESLRYQSDPNYVWCDGMWRTHDGAERKRENGRRYYDENRFTIRRKTLLRRSRQRVETVTQRALEMYS